MQTSPSRPEDVNIFYGQSWSTVKFLVDQFGQPKFAQLFKTIHDGSRIDDALNTVYGFNQDGLYNAWRQKNGLQPVATSGPTTGQAPAAQGTRAPLGVPTSSGGSSANQPAATATTSGDTTSSSKPAEDSGGSNTTAALIILGVAVLLAAGLGGGGVYLMRQQRKR
jgi:hypothetical protein